MTDKDPTDLSLAAHFLKDPNTNSAGTLLVLRPDLLIPQLQNAINAVKEDIVNIHSTLVMIDVYSGYHTGRCSLEDRFRMSPASLSEVSMGWYTNGLRNLKIIHNIDSNESLESVLAAKHQQIAQINQYILSLILKVLESQ